MANRFYRLRIRNADNTADDLVVTSVAGGTNPYIAEPPSGDGQAFDPLKGSSTAGSYSVLVLDPEISAGNRLVTSKLADAQARQQLLKRRAFVDESADAAAWSVLIKGYCNAIRLVDAITFDVAIGDMRGVEASREVWKTVTPVFDRAMCLMGGPVRGGWGPMRDYGGWRFKVKQATDNPRYVSLELVSGFDPVDYKGTFTKCPDAIGRRIYEATRAYFTWDERWWASRTIRGYFPSIQARIQLPNGTHVGTFAPIARPAPQNLFLGPDDLIFWTDNNILAVHWDTGALPSVGAQFDVYLMPAEISETNPLHISAHPVELVEMLCQDLGIDYDASVLPALKAQVYPDLIIDLRITSSMRGGEAFEMVCGPFGIGPRNDSEGRRVFFSSRIKNSEGPAETISLNELRSDEGTVFDNDEATICNKVTFRLRRFVPIAASSGASSWFRPAPAPAESLDGVEEVPHTISVDNGEDVGPDNREVVYEIPGTIRSLASSAGSVAELFATGVAAEIFDRYGRGAIAGELHCGPDVAALLGAEVYLSLSHLPNAVIGQTPVSQRGGNRIVQVVRRTETTEGPSLRYIDSGTDAQPAVLPAFTLAQNAGDPRKLADIALTNAATLAAQGSFVRVEIGYGATEPASGTLLTTLNPAAETALTTHPVDAGTKVWIRMRSEAPGKRPSTYTLWASVQLDALDAPTSLAVTAQAPGDISLRTLTWVPGANASDIPLEILTRAGGADESEDRVLIVLPPGSTRLVLSGLEAGTIVASVRHRESPPAAGVSPKATVDVVTTGAAAQLAPPIDPAAFSGSLDPEIGAYVADGRYGIEVTAREFHPASVEVEVKTGAGAFEHAGKIPSVLFGRTRWTGFAPNDGILRTLRARHVAQGRAPSSWTPEVSCTPWVPQAPTLPTPSDRGLNNYRLLYESATELVYGWDRGPLVASVWAAVLTLATPIVGDPFTIVAAQVQMLPADQNTLRIPKPPHKHITFWQVEPRLEDFTIRLETEIRRGHVEAEAPQPPIWSLDAREFNNVGTLYWKIPPRGETIVSVMASAHTGGLPSFSYVNAHRGPGDQSYVKDRTLIADEYEHDVKLGKGRMSFITPRVVLASGAIMSPGPIPFDLDVEPRIAHAWAEAQTVHVVGDSDVKSIRFRQVDVNGLPLSWVRWLDGIGGSINVPVPNDTKWYVEVTVFALPKDDAGVLTSASDSRTLVVQGPLTEGTQMPFGWDQFELSIPAIGEKEVTLALKAIAGAALLGHRWRVRARRKDVDGTWTDMGKITGQLVPLPDFAGAPPPTTLTEYTWDGLPAGYESSYPTSGAQKVEVELVAEITLATQVAATLSRRVSWYVGGSADEPPPPPPPPPPPTAPPPTTETDWISVALTVPTLATKEVGITLHATAASGMVELLRRIHTEGWSSPLEIAGDVTPALSSPPAAETGYAYDGLGPELARTDNPGQSTVTFELTARIKNSAGLIVATATRSVQWIYGGDIT